MILSQYLTDRGVKELALTHLEAKILGLAWPLEKGWTFRFGQIRIDDDQLVLLRSALGVKRAKQKSAKFSFSDSNKAISNDQRAQIGFGTTVGENYKPSACKCLPWEDCACRAE